ncbi:hypothetical protein LCGC14_2773770 [marine sediment metagenome]|uniref:Uncharacterized protein n=1 Tax=marine sediment metagenome TaxID=412755 RepID=A0A0F8ZHA8_9ZZZZ
MRRTWWHKRMWSATYRSVKGIDILLWTFHLPRLSRLRRWAVDRWSCAHWGHVTGWYDATGYHRGCPRHGKRPHVRPTLEA